jgi:hypothetical protein
MDPLLPTLLSGETCRDSVGSGFLNSGRTRSGTRRSLSSPGTASVKLCPSWRGTDERGGRLARERCSP